jgi:tRNA 2-thiouridine synthesizing protein A
MVTGEVLRVVATDPGSVRDFKAFSKQTGNELLSHLEGVEEFEYFIKRK